MRPRCERVTTTTTLDRDTVSVPTYASSQDDEEEDDVVDEDEEEDDVEDDDDVLNDDVINPAYRASDPHVCSNHPFYSRSMCFARRSGSFRNVSPAMASFSSSSSFSPRSGRFCDARFEEHHQPHFLDACFLCKKPLGDNRDIFMYRGDTPFCSEECRDEQIEIDEAKEKNWNHSSSINSKKTTKLELLQEHIQQPPQNLHASRQLEPEMGGEDSPSTADSRGSRANMSIYGQNFAMPMHPPNFALITPPSIGSVSDASGSEKKQQLQGSKAGVEASQTFAMSFASLNGATAARGIDLTSINHARGLRAFPRIHIYISRRARELTKRSLAAVLGDCVQCRCSMVVMVELLPLSPRSFLLAPHPPPSLQKHHI